MKKARAVSIVYLRCKELCTLTSCQPVNVAGFASVEQPTCLALAQLLLV